MSSLRAAASGGKILGVCLDADTVTVTWRSPWPSIERIRTLLSRRPPATLCRLHLPFTPLHGFLRRGGHYVQVLVHELH